MDHTENKDDRIKEKKDARKDLSRKGSWGGRPPEITFTTQMGEQWT